jgi:hypothetical protein
MGWAPLALAAVQALQQRKQGQEDAALAEQNARMIDLQAADVMWRGAQDAGRIRAEGAKIEGSQKVAVAANGVDSTSGSAANMFIASQQNAAADAEQAKNNAAREAWGYKVEAYNQRARGKAAKQAGNLGAAGSLISGAGQAYKNYRGK